LLSTLLLSKSVYLLLLPPLLLVCVCVVGEESGCGLKKAIRVCLYLWYMKEMALEDFNWPENIN